MIRLALLATLAYVSYAGYNVPPAQDPVPVPVPVYPSYPAQQPPQYQPPQYEPPQYQPPRPIYMKPLYLPELPAPPQFLYPRRHHHHHRHSRSDSRSHEDHRPRPDDDRKCRNVRTCEHDAKCVEPLFWKSGKTLEVSCPQGYFKLYANGNEILSEGVGVSKVLTCNRNRWSTQDIHGDFITVRSIGCTKAK
ncbi:unnamed protein product [Nippostrongylus brasiliensis]|uniref:Sushi domain-containing protein n=1 Tax=Nippostrongylus brasiliensis TaxID=27835 RepID=A0A0N4Y6N1_NIPBR|nr:unnamed protein product [Nippostrongylus brasiliensis]